LHRTILEYLAAAHVSTLPDPLKSIEPLFLWQPKPDGEYRWQSEAGECIPFLTGLLDDPSSLLRHLVKEHESRPDFLATMLRLAGRCLSEIDGQLPDVDKCLADTIVSGLADVLREWPEATELGIALAH